MLTGDYFAYTIADKLGISKQLISQDIKWLKKKKYIIDLYPKQNKFKDYILSELGKKALVEYEKAEQRKLYKIENARHKTIIQNDENLKHFISYPKYHFKQNKKFKNSKAYFGRIEGWTCAIFIGKETSLVITPPPIFADNMMKAHVKANQNMLDFCFNLDKKWAFNLSLPEPTNHRQYAINDNFAKSILQDTGGSQIKIETEEGVVSIDQSGGREPRVEFDSASRAQNYLEVPKEVASLKAQVLQTQKILHQSNNLMATGLKNNTESIDKMREFLKTMFSEVNDSKEPKRSISDDAKNMFM